MEQRRLFLEEWPSLDRTAWLAACTPAGPLDEPPPLAEISPASRRMMEESWGHFLQVLALNHDLDMAAPPRSRPTIERLSRHIRLRRQTLAPYSMHLELLRIQLALRALEPDIDWSWIRRHPEAPRRAEMRGSRSEKVTFDPAVMTLHCYDLMDEADARPSGARASVTFRDGLLGALLCHLPVRRRNLVNLRLGRHLRGTPDGFQIVIGPQETKNFVPIDDTLTGHIASYVARYLDQHRRLLLNGRESDAVWIGVSGRPMRDGAFTRGFHQLGIAVVGQPVSPHSFRRSQVSAVLARDPRDLDRARDALGHRSAATTNQYYDLSGREASQGVLEGIIREIRHHPPEEDE